ncbi:MAG: PDZ domain-containing protein [Candidatus Eremiobacteraeota bacterium]|nr:PDZ domain-containing protein [Candidatus Eremiobacteraeota bacterium]
MLRFLNLALVIALAFFAADLTSALIEKRLAVAPMPIEVALPAIPTEPQPAKAAPPGLGELLALSAPDPGDVAAETPGGGPSQAPTPQPAARLTLKGTMSGQGLSLAMIDINGTTEVVGVGETVGEFTLVSVGPYSAVVRRAGVDQTLEMASGQSQQVSVAPVPAFQQPQPQGLTTAQPVVPPETPAGGSLSQAELRNMIDNPDPGNFKMRPIQRDGETIGFQVYLASQTHPLYRLGIRNGDIVTSVNELPLNGTEALSAAYREIRNTPNLKFTVERGGQTLPISVNLTE